MYHEAMTEQRTLRRRLVDDLRRQGFLRDERVAEAFATVPRHPFLPGQPLKDVYTDRAFVTKQLDSVPVSSSSQPAIMAVMLEQLGLEPGQRVLEIGAGTGYNAALLSRLTGESGRVTTIDIDPEVAEAARSHLRSAGYEGVTVVTADGGFGHPQGAPYDRIIVTAGCWQIPQPWVDQLVEGGILVLPMRVNGAHICLAFRKEDGELVSRRAAECGFMPLRGAFWRQPTQMAVPNLRVSADVPLDARVERALQRLIQKDREIKLTFPRGRDRKNSPLYYLILQGKPVLLLLRRADTWWGEVPFALLVSPESAIALSWHRPKRGRLTLFGTDEALDFLREALARWQAEGRPDLRDLRARVRASRARLGPLPRPVDGCYRFRRGDHLYELWFER